MEPIAKDRDRLLYHSARVLGVVTTLVSLVALSIPGMIDWPRYLVMIACAVALLTSLYRLGEHPHLGWVIVGIISALALLAVPVLLEGPEHAPSLPAALAPIAGGTLAALSLVLLDSVRRMLILAAAFVTSVVLMQILTGASGTLSEFTAIVILCWILAGFLGGWLTSSVPRAARRIFSMGRAHRAERQASETEAQRRQSARLLHDTVLATLTLLAHSGVGVAPEALRQQADEDARLLRQLRLGTGGDQGTPGVAAATEKDDAASTTLQSVKNRFTRIGLEVSWHGTGQVLLPPESLDAFLLALAECLENVRRHAGVTEAHVTITDDETTVRALVTDSGSGFDVTEIDSARMGLKESVVGRLGEVGGNARLFSAPGSGTTVVLEVPKR